MELFSSAMGDFDMRKEPPYPDQKLQSAVKADIGHLAYLASCDPNAKVPSWIRGIVENLRRSHEGAFVNLEDISWNDVSGQFYDQLFLGGDGSFIERWMKSHQIATQLCDAFKQHMIGTGFKIDSKAIWPTILTLFSHRMNLTIVKNYMVATTRQTDIQIKVHHYQGVRFYMSRELCLVKFPTRSLFVDYQSVLLLMDVIEQRYLAFLTAFMLSQYDFGLYQFTEDKMRVLFQWGDRLLMRMGNEAFNAIKFYEAICISALLAKDDKCNLSEMFVANTRDGFIEAGGMPDEYDELFSYLKSLPHNTISELFGLYRLWGHPIVDEVEGCRKVKQIGKREIIPDRMVLLRSYACLMREFCVNFIRKEGRWPHIYVQDDNSRINRLYTRRMLNWIEEIGSTTLDDWIGVVPEKNFEFDYYLDYTQMIDDKAISSERPFWDNVYDKTLLGYTPPQSNTSRRVILEMLRREDLSIHSIIETISCGLVPKDWFVVGLHSKEREVKIAPRLFAMMPLEMRLYFCATEHNIATKIFPYFPQQTMTSSESDLTTRILRMAEARGQKSDSIQVIINVDFEKWNLNWRYESTLPTFEFLDAIFGLNHVYTFSHEFFRKSMFYLVSRYQIPSGLNENNRLSLPECDTVWYNDGSGKEGIRQKGWTLATIACLLYVEELTKVPGVITGQGDNQVIVASFQIPRGLTKQQYLDTRRHELRNSVLRYMKILSSTFESIGLPVKLEESWMHTDVFAYGKDLLYKGATLSMVLKKAVRIMPDINDVYPSLTNTLATIYSGGQTACSKGFDIFIPYYISTLEALLAMLSACKFSPITGGKIFNSMICDKIYKDRQFLAFLVTLPHSLGGYPIMTPLDYAYRGHPDPVTSGLCSIRILSDIIPIYKQLYTLMMSGALFKSSQDLELLVLDPVSINWDLPDIMTSLTRRFVDDQFSAICKNKQLLTLFHANHQEEDEWLLQILYRIRPAAPRILSEIYRHSPSGARVGILAKVAHVRTLRVMAQRTNNQYMFDLVARCELNWMTHMLTWYERAKGFPSTSIGCSVVAANILRSKSWYPNMEIVLEGVTMPHPIEQFKLERYTNFQSDPEGILYILDKGDNPDDSCLISKGPLQAYIGSLTQERKVSRLLNIPVKEPSIISALRLQTLADYITTETDDLYRFLTVLIMLRTNIPLFELRATTDRIIAGSRSHRLQDVRTKHGALINVRPNFSTYVYYSTDLLGRYVLGFENYSILYQSIMLYHILLLQYHHPRIVEKCSYLGKFACASCTFVYDEEPLHLEEFVDIAHVDYSQCYLVYSYRSEQEWQHILESGRYIKEVSSASTGIDRARTVTAYMLALQLILRSDRAAIGHLLGHRETQLTDSGTLLGIGEISAIGFVPLLLAIGHLNFLLYLVRYFNREIRYRGIRVCDILVASIEHCNYGLYKELRDAYPIEDIRREVCDTRCTAIDSASAIYGRGGTHIIIQSLLYQLLQSHILSMDTLPSLPCSTFPEWFLIIQLNILHRAVKIFWAEIPQTSLDQTMGAICVALKTMERMPESITASDLLVNMIAHCDRLIRVPHLYNMLGQSSLADLIIGDRPILRSVDPLIMWMKRVKAHKRESKILYTKPIYRYETPPSPKLWINQEITPLEGQLHAVDLPDDARTSVDIKLRHDHAFRLDGLSTAHYKYLPIIQQYCPSPDKVICVGEGEGSVARMILLVFNPSMLFYNSLIKPRNYIMHRMVHHCPSELQEFKDRLFRFNATLYGENDLQTELCLNTLLCQLGDHKWNLITCDAESTKYGKDMAFLILRNLLLISHNLLDLDGTLIYKTYLGLKNTVRCQVMAMQCFFQHVHITVPHYSSFESTEIFLVGCGLTTDREEAVEILRSGKYCSTYIDDLACNQLLENLLERRITYARDLPLQMVDIAYVEKLMTFSRRIYNKPNFMRAINVLTGAVPRLHEKDLATWLCQRAETLQNDLNVIIRGLYASFDPTLPIDRLYFILVREVRNNEEIYAVVRKILHCYIMLQIINNEVQLRDRGIIGAIQFVDGMLKERYNISAETGNLLTYFTLMRSERVWRKHYARHMYHFVGEVVFRPYLLYV